MGDIYYGLSAINLSILKLMTALISIALLIRYWHRFSRICVTFISLGCLSLACESFLTVLNTLLFLGDIGIIGPIGAITGFLNLIFRIGAPVGFLVGLFLAPISKNRHILMKEQ